MEIAGKYYKKQILSLFYFTVGYKYRVYSEVAHGLVEFGIKAAFSLYKFFFLKINNIINKIIIKYIKLTLHLQSSCTLITLNI